MKRLVVLVSNKGTGTNLQAIIDAIESGKLNAQIVTVVSDTEESQVLDRAKKHNIPVKICPQKENLLSVLTDLAPDYICLAGWKQIIIDEVVDAFPQKITNTHPGIIPDNPDTPVKNPDGTDALWNKGKLTYRAIQNVLDNHATYAGATNHFLTKDVDFGKVLGRVFEKVLPGDTVDSLYTRLKKKENVLYVEVLQKLCP